jgi:hypothetical protein
MASRQRHGLDLTVGAQFPFHEHRRDGTVDDLKTAVAQAVALSRSLSGDQFRRNTHEHIAMPPR